MPNMVRNALSLCAHNVRRTSKMRSLKDTALPAVGRGPAGKVSLSADSVPTNIGYGFQRYFVAEMKLEDRRPARTIQGMPPWLFSDGSEARLSREGIHHREQDRKSTRLNSSHITISYAVFCLKKKKKNIITYHFTN